MINANKFTPAAYLEILGSLRSAGYQIRDYADAAADRTDLILRHDVDMSLALALDMARIEQSANARSTYFVLVRTEFYNVFSENGTRLIRDIAALGHEVGLHLDAALYGPNEDLDDRAAEECDMLEFAVGRPVRTISFHRPAPFLIGSSPTLGNRINAYAPHFVKEMGYCTDSRGDWHYGHPLEHNAFKERRALHLLTHPIWWMGEELTMTQRLDGFLERRERELDSELARHCIIHTPHTGPKK